MNKQFITENQMYLNIGSLLPGSADYRLRISYLHLGVLLISLFFLQNIFDLNLTFLLQWQQQEFYKQLSGYVLLSYILLQWQLGISRMKDRTALLSRRYYWHKWRGAVAPLFLYIHTMNLGYGYQLILSIIYLANFSVGIFSCEILGIKHKFIRPIWLTAHIALAVLTLVLALFHLYIIYWYS